MHESDARSISTVPKGEQVKMTSFLALGGKFCTGIFCFRASRFARTKKTDLGSGQESESVRKFFLVVECVNVRKPPQNNPEADKKQLGTIPVTG